MKFVVFSTSIFFSFRVAYLFSPLVITFLIGQVPLKTKTVCNHDTFITPLSGVIVIFVFVVVPFYGTDIGGQLPRAQKQSALRQNVCISVVIVFPHVTCNALWLEARKRHSPDR